MVPIGNVSFKLTEVFVRRYWDTKFDELGIPEGVRFSLREMLDSDNLTQAQRRNIKSGISIGFWILRISNNLDIITR